MNERTDLGALINSEKLGTFNFIFGSKMYEVLNSCTDMPVKLEHIEGVVEASACKVYRYPENERVDVRQHVSSIARSVLGSRKFVGSNKTNRPPS